MNISDSDLSKILGNAKRLTQQVDAQYGVKQSNVMVEEDMHVPNNASFNRQQENFDDYGRYDLMAEQRFNASLDNIKANAAKSKMPEAIKRSIIESPIETEPTSALDRIASSARLNEQKNSSNGNSLEQTIMKCLDRYFKENNGLKTVSISEGKIRLIDNSGRIFSANLEYKGNVNDKKKK